ncbi:DNA-binding transcription factor yap1 [Mortierella sp. NVP85]|nr:DNA-binding transcription factor yap1 [Mortierella sp. NVP85]
MTSTIRHPLPQLRIIQQRFDRPDKRPYSSTESSGKVGTSEQHGSGEDEPNSRQSGSNESHYSSSSEPPTKIRKKPGRKPNPASPALRKEQNRAAQRAFRDRKERHLQDLEGSIKELKEANAKITQQSQQDAQQFKAAMENLQSENYYLRQVVLSFESALSKSGNAAILYEVKAELYHRHYEKYTKGISEPTPLNRDTDQPVPSLFIPNATIPPQPPTEGASHRTSERAPADTTTPTTSTSTCTKTAIPSTPKTSSSPASSSPLDTTSSGSGSASSPQTPTLSVWEQFGDKPADSQDDILFSANSTAVYKTPASNPQQDMNNGKLVKAISPFDPLSFPRPFFTETGAYLAKRTEYTNGGNVFDELQSSLFPPGTLQSIIHTGLSTPQEIVNDASLLDQLHDRRPLRDPVICPGQATITFSATTTTLDNCMSSVSTSVLEEDVEVNDNEFEIATATLGLDDGLKQEVIPSHRLQLEIKVLASAPPAVDPNIDAKIYALPHDPRIDLIPCPRLRAMMILHQRKFNVDELCQLLLDGAKCHGHPLDPHSWELPDSFFDRFGFLLGEDMLRHRSKTWPQKDDPSLGKE